MPRILLLIEPNLITFNPPALVAIFPPIWQLPLDPKVKSAFEDYKNQASSFIFAQNTSTFYCYCVTNRIYFSYFV